MPFPAASSIVVWACAASDVGVCVVMKLRSVLFSWTICGSIRLDSTPFDASVIFLFRFWRFSGEGGRVREDTILYCVSVAIPLRLVVERLWGYFRCSFSDHSGQLCSRLFGGSTRLLDYSIKTAKYLCCRRPRCNLGLFIISWREMYTYIGEVMRLV